mmetsp:Transcript_10158/g.12875  ORF Transcript_10158/g.12875 Transcript_10158/m.12875 type:complete len:270 (+) Transcript_10158:205-1014(+)
MSSKGCNHTIFIIVALTTHLFCCFTHAFVNNNPITFNTYIKQHNKKYQKENPTQIMAVSGSFFNPVPEQNDDDDERREEEMSSSSPAQGSNETDAFDESLARLMKKRSKKPLASKPSTVGGIPTSKVTGFGNAKGPQIVNKIQSASTKKSFVGIGKPLNDVRNPEYDDQGYTLYANEETGKKQRVFEALIEYPCEFKMKIIGANEGPFAKEMVQVVADSCNVESEIVKFTERKNGKWISVTVFAPVENAEMLYALYENIDRDPRVKFKF